MPQLKIIGKVTLITDVTYKKNNVDNTKQTVFVETADKYNGAIAFDVFDDKIKFKEGEIVDVDCNISSKNWDGRCFHNINAWRKNAVENKTAPANVAPSTPNHSAALQNMVENPDLPF